MIALLRQKNSILLILFRYFFRYFLCTQIKGFDTFDTFSYKTRTCARNVLTFLFYIFFYKSIESVESIENIRIATFFGLDTFKKVSKSIEMSSFTTILTLHTNKNTILLA